MALLNDDALETGGNVYKIASERSERADFFVYLRWNTILLKSQYIHCWSITVCRYNMSMTVFVTLVIWSCSLYWLENKKLEKNDIERAERASQNICTFASEKCFTYRPETREKAIINDCEQANFLCVSETCDSSQYFVGESHSLSVHRPCASIHHSDLGGKS